MRRHQCCKSWLQTRQTAKADLRLTPAGYKITALQSTESCREGSFGNNIQITLSNMDVSSDWAMCRKVFKISLLLSKGRKSIIVLLMPQ